MFFCIELIKINITKEALQSICEEATYLTIAHDYKDGADLIKKVDAIVEKYRPSFIPKEAKAYTEKKFPVIRWAYEVYYNLSDMLSKAPYGGTTVTYSPYNRTSDFDEPAKYHATLCRYRDISNFIPAAGMEAPANPDNWVELVSHMKNEGLPDNRVFVLTVMCNYPFSSSMVKMLFGGGVNTKLITFWHDVPRSADSCKKGNMYILWARGAGIVNPK